MDNKIFKASDVTKRQKTLESKLISLNAQMVSEVKTNYIFIAQLIKFHVPAKPIHDEELINRVNAYRMNILKLG